MILNEKCNVKNVKCKIMGSREKFAIRILQWAFCICLCIGESCLLPSIVVAQQVEPTIASVRVGVADCYKVGLWTQVEIVVQGGSEPLVGELSVVVPDGDGIPSRVSTSPEYLCAITPHQKTVVRLLCRLGRVNCTLTAQLRVKDAVVARRTFSTAAQADGEHFLPGLEFRDLIVTVGSASLGTEELGRLRGLDPQHRPITAKVENIEQLPTDWRGYEGVDAVIVAAGRSEIYGKLSADSAQMRALDEWIRMGGRLVLCAGTQAEKMLAKDSPWRQFAPGRLEKMVTLRQTGALENFCGSRSGAMHDGVAAMRVPYLTDVQGTIEVREADLPLVVRTVRGFGQIIFLAADLDQTPLDTWHDRPMLVAKLLDMPTGNADESDESKAMMHFGFGDMSGQLRSALDSFTGVHIAPFWLVAGLIVVYLLLIGPGDYFFLRRLIGRMGWTWFTFPLIVLLMCAGAYLLAYRLKGDRLKVNQVDLVDVDAASSLVRGTTWLDIFSPRMETFNLSLKPLQPNSDAAGNTHSWVTWLGLPGGALGGMNPRAGDAALGMEPYGFSPSLDAMHDVPIPVWSTKSFTGRWITSTRAFPQAELADENQLLVGSVTNTFNYPLEHCLLAYGRSVYELGTLAPGESARVGSMSKRSELKTLLTGRKIVAIDKGDKYQQEATPYDQASRDIYYILRMMMFHDAAGGRRYTGLWNAYQDFVDFSSLLHADRAILVAQRPASDSAEKSQGASLLRDGQPLADSPDKHLTIYRFVFPVKREKGG